MEWGEQKGFVYHINGVAATIPATSYKDPMKIIVERKGSDEMTESKKEMFNVENGNRAEILQILRKTIGEKAFFEWAIGGLRCLLQEEILQYNLHEKRIFEDWEYGTILFECSFDSTEYKRINNSKERVRNMWENWKNGCTSQRWELSEQQYRELTDFMSKLSFETASREECLQDLWESSEGIWILRKALSKIQKIRRPLDSKKMQWTTNSRKYRIRKLTPTCCYRLMGFKDEDVEKARKLNVSNSSLYKQAGNSIITNCVQLIAEHLYKAQYDNTYVCTDENFTRPQ